MSDLNSDFSSAFIATCSFETSVCRVFSKESADTFITSSFCKVKVEARKSMNFGAAGPKTAATSSGRWIRFDRLYLYQMGSEIAKEAKKILSFVD